MTTYNTGNPIGSPDPRDLYDNAQVIDDYANSEAETTNDRLGVERATIAGIDAAARSAIAQAGYEFVGDYAAGIELTAYNQAVRDTSGEFWRVSGSTALPYTTTGAGLPEGGAFVTVGDAALRQDLVQPVATFNNVQDMKDATGLDVGRKVRTLGYYAPGDGGGNDYEIVSAATGTDDGGSFIDLAGSGTQAKGLFTGQTGYSVRQFGARGNYIDWSNKGDDDWAAFQSALNTGVSVVWFDDGKYRIHEKSLLIKHQGQTLLGPGNGMRAYIPASMYEQAKPKSAIVPTGTAQRDIITKRRWRGSENDPQDDPISTVINHQAAGTTCEGVVIYLDIDWNDRSPTNYGADWDVGFFNGNRRNVHWKQCSVFGYFRKAGFYTDVTNHPNFPAFSSSVHGDLPNPDNSNVDQSYCFDITSSGPLKDFVVLGPLPPTGQITYDEYYDEVSGQLVSDARGAAGAADLYINKYFFGNQHFSRQRRYDPVSPLSPESEDLDALECNILVDGRGAADAVDGQGTLLRKIRFSEGRTSGTSAFQTLLGRVSGIRFLDVQGEPCQSGFDTDGIEFSTSNDFYGSFACLNPDKSLKGNRANCVILEGFNGLEVADRLKREFFQSRLETYHVAGGEISSDGTRNNEYSRFDIGAEMSTGKISENNYRINVESGNGLLLTQGGAGRVRVLDGGILEISSGSGEDIRIRQGNDLNSFRVSPTHITTNRIIAPSVDDGVPHGLVSQRFSEYRAVNSTINTSDGREKCEVIDIPDSVLDAWGEVEWVQYRWINRVDAKGDDARIHFGVIAQQIRDVFSRHGLDAFRYSLLCYDEWDEVDEIKEWSVEEGKWVVTQRHLPAGNRYGIRYEQAQAVEAAYQRRRLARLEAKIQEMEQANG